MGTKCNIFLVILVGILMTTNGFTSGDRSLANGNQYSLSSFIFKILEKLLKATRSLIYDPIYALLGFTEDQIVAWRNLIGKLLYKFIPALNPNGYSQNNPINQSQIL